MKKIIRLTEKDLSRIVQRVLIEQKNNEISQIEGREFLFYHDKEEKRKPFFNATVEKAIIEPNGKIEIFFDVSNNEHERLYNQSPTNPVIFDCGTNRLIGAGYNKEFTNFLMKFCADSYQMSSIPDKN